MIEVNEFQTQLSDDFLSSLKEEVRSDLFDLINNVEFIKRLISKDRPRAKDCKRDNSGRIIVDLSNPHILENMDYFRQAGIHWQKHGVYTKLLPNSNPASEYGQWLKREINRCWNGMVRESDGEWITGDMYFYLNYFPIIQTQLIPGTLIGDRVSDLPEVWEGVYWRFHYWHQAKYGGKYNEFKGGKHCVEIAARGRSKSYSFGSKLAKNFLLGENSATRKGKVKSVINAYQKEYLTKDGTITKFLDGIEHCAKYTQFPSKKLKESNSDMHWVLGFIDKVDGSEKGLKNEVIGLAVKDDTEKGRGKRSSWFGIEEFGAFKGFLDYWQTSIPNVQEGSVLFGQISSIGTGGSEGSNFMGALEMINHPEGYNVYSLPNIYDKGSSGNKTTIFFFPGYVNVKGYYNKDGVSDVVGSILSELEFRYVLKYNSSDPMQLTRRKAETAFTLQDAIMRRDSSLYPSDKLNDVILNLSLDPKYTDDMWIGKLSMNSIDGVKFVIDRDSKYITEFPHKNNKIEGAVCIKQMPIKDSSGKIPWGRYIGGVDTYDDDTSETMSLFSMFILDMWTDELVFEYTGRPPFAEDAYETCRMAAIMYNAEVLYENNKKGLFKHFSQHSSLYLLADSPSFLKDKEDVSFGKINNKTKGVGNYGTVGPYARRCVRDWLMKENKIIKSDVDENGKEVQLIENSLSLYSIWSKALAQELSMWNPDGNFDRHDALCMLMLLREEKYRLNGILTPEEAAKNRDINYLGNDDFFNKNYHSKIKENDIYN